MSEAGQYQHHPSACELATVKTRQGRQQVTLGELRQMRHSLSQKLAQDAFQYTALSCELDAAAAFIDGECRGHIGAWQLTEHGGRLVLLRQQTPRRPQMLFYIAPLSQKEGTWQVDAIVPQKVRGR